MDSAAVAGAGTMGSGIAQVLAAAGFAVTLIDVEELQLQRARAIIERSLARLVDKGTLAADERDATLKRIKTTSDTEAAAEAKKLLETLK